MGDPARARFGPGRNIALKTPPEQFDRLVAFYRDVAGLEMKSSGPDGATFAWGDATLWVDRVPALSQPEVWLELTTDDPAAAAARLAEAGVARRDDIEPLPAGFPGFWISAPGGLIHLISAETA